MARLQPHARQHLHPLPGPRHPHVHRRRQRRLGAHLQPQPVRGRHRVHGRPGHRAVLSVDALHLRAPRPARHPRRRRGAPAVHRGHRGQLPGGPGERQPGALLRGGRGELLAWREGAPRCRHRAGRRARDRQVHRRAGRRGHPGLHQHHDLPDHAVAAPRQGPARSGPPLTTTHRGWQTAGPGAGLAETEGRKVPGMAAGDIPVPGTLPAVIAVRGARHNNLRDVDVDVPLWRTVAVVGVSGSGKTSLAMGTLYAEGMQRFLESLSTYSRRRLTQAQRPDVDRIDHLPPALALRQRPPVPGPRSTVGTMSEVLNVLRLMMSRLGSHLCPNGHMVPPSIAVEQEEIVCPVCGAHFVHPGAESFAFNSYGACPACQGLGVRSEVDETTLVPDPDLTIEDGAVLPWNSGGRRLSMYAAGQLGVRLDVPYKELTDREKDIVLHGEPVKRQVTLSGRNGRTVQLSVNYDNAVAAVERSLRSNNERTRRLVQRFLITRVCSVCHGTELSRMTTGLLAELDVRFPPLLDVGLSYLTLDRAGATLSTGERQRIELTSTVRASTTGMLYVLDEPSVGLHPSNVAGLLTTIRALAGNGNSVIVVEHEREVIRSADWVIELGPAAGTKGGTVIAQGPPGRLEKDPNSVIGPFLAGTATVTRDRPARPHSGGPGPDGQITIEIGDLYNLHDLTAAFPVGRLTALAGPSGAGKTALVLDSLIPAARARLSGGAAPGHVRRLDLGGIRQIVQIDASPIGQNARSTPATYSGAFDHIRREFAESAYARRRRWKPGHFSFNTREGQCPTCLGLGHIDLDVQYLPDITVQCPTCHGARFNDATLAVRIDGLTIADVLD